MGQCVLKDWSNRHHFARGPLGPALSENALGLMMAHRLAEAMGGKISFDEGFLFEVPIGRAVRPLVSSSSALESRRPAQTWLRFDGKISILVVEDAKVNRRLILAYFERMGVRAEAVGDGAAAVVRSKQIYFDDFHGYLHTPFGRAGRDGGHSCQQGPCRDVPILALTANAKPKDVEHCLNAGMNGHITKPVDPARLGQAFSRWLGVARDEEAPSVRTTGPTFDDPLDSTALDDLVANAGGALATELIGDFLTDPDTRLEVLQQAAKEMGSATLVKVCHSIQGSAGLFGASELAELAVQIKDEAKHLSRGEAFRLVSELSVACGRSRNTFGSWQTQHATALEAIERDRGEEPDESDRL